MSDNVKAAIVGVFAAAVLGLIGDLYVRLNALERDVIRREMLEYRLGRIEIKMSQEIQ